MRNLSALGAAWVFWLCCAAALDAQVSATGAAREPAAAAPRDARFVAGHLLFEVHRNPSASSLFVFDWLLRPVAVLDGWVELAQPGGLLIYQHSSVHFAPTHSAELWSFDLPTKRHAKVYPVQPYDSLRLAYISRVRVLYDRLGADWFRINNHHMDPERFDSHLVSQVVANDSAAAFLMSFGDDRGNPADSPVLEVLVRCSLVISKPTCRETALSAARAARPGVSDSDLLLAAVGGTGGFR